jgi:transcription-repair coupling factor (superfamily II helicase)
MASELAPLLEHIANHERAEAIAITLRERPGARIHIAPTLSAARPAFVAALAIQLATPIVYVVTNSDAANRAYADICQWLDPRAVLLFPAGDALPYEQMSPAAGVAAGRLNVIRRLTEFDHRPPTTDHKQSISVSESSVVGRRSSIVIVTSVKALIQPTLSQDEWRAVSVTLRQGEEHNPDDLIERWIAMGYRSAPTVEEPGEINRRGGIIDIFPPGDELPLRIEFFGDEIDSMRRFDVVTQRSQERLRETIVGPPHETPLWEKEPALERLRSVSVAQLRPEARDEWNAALDRLAQGDGFESRSFFAPFYREQGHMPTLFEHLPPGAPLMFSEQILLAQHAVELHQQTEDRRCTHIENGELPLAYPRPYLLWDDLLRRAGEQTLVDLSNNEPGESATDQEGRAQFVSFSTHLTPPRFTPAELFGGQLKRLVEDIIERLCAGERVVAVTPQAARLQELVEEALQGTGNREQGTETSSRPLTPDPRPLMVHGSLDQGWHSPDLNATLYSDAEIFGWRQRRPVSERTRSRDRSAEERAAFLRGLKVGDYVVHIEHGIAQYDGLVRRSVGGIDRDYLNLRYTEGDRLYVPVDQIDRVSRYIGSGEGAPQLTRLGTQEWERAKRKARAAVQDLAEDLLQLYAQRQLSEGHAFSPDNDWQRDLEASFAYIETDDQLRAIAAVKHDMELIQPMDRLICGDVGFGKTEVALRAAFKAVQDGKQVAILVPTTVLAQQHYDTFSRRMAAYPIKIQMISRMRSAQEQAQIVNQVARGEIDIIIGTHRLLSKDIHFKDLGLLVVDEEQRFGVRHKERIKQLRANVDVLTLTATPIPRTLHMALAGIRDMSVIDTPPEDRLPIKTYVLPSDDKLIREAVVRELDRGGQVFYVHNRVHSIYYVADRLKRLAPEADIIVGHGQLEERQLERVMLDFFSGKADVLVCTTIIESGLDVSNANTIIIDDAINYGLAQLYQLRGRVGRSAQRAYAYLFYPSDRRMTAEAQERLLAIQEATELGAGLRIAMRDLEIRGAGNLLGAEQSGHIAAVGFDLYTRLLNQAVQTLKAQFAASRPMTKDEGRRTEDGGRRTEDEGRGTKDGGQPMENGRRPANGEASSSAHPGSRAPAQKGPKVKVDEKVLVGPLVTLDLPLDAYIPPEYIADDQVRLSVYQRLAEAHTTAAVRDLRQELRDRFGEPPEPAECLLTWLQIKALALQASVTSIVTTDEEFIVRLPDGGAADRELLRRRYSRDRTVKIGPQFLRIDRRELKEDWIKALTNVLETLGKPEPSPSRERLRA